MKKSKYDEIGGHYSNTRMADPRIAGRILQGLDQCTSVLNVGAGTGSYEPTDRLVFAVEPSITMIRQRAIHRSPVVQGIAEMLPFGNHAVDAAMAILTVHHWSDPSKGLAELRRVARSRVVVLTWDQAVWESFWLVEEYFPCVHQLDRDREVAIKNIVSALGRSEVVTVPVPRDCLDGFFGAFWQRPQAYLDPQVRTGISSFSLMSSADLNDGLARLKADLESGAWLDKHGNLLELQELDLGYRLIIA